MRSTEGSVKIHSDRRGIKYGNLSLRHILHKLGDYFQLEGQDMFLNYKYLCCSTQTIPGNIDEQQIFEKVELNTDGNILGFHFFI